MSNEPRGRVIVVIGMHRSGTSLVTRGLRALGVELGANLAVESAPDNAKGHWEDRGRIRVQQAAVDRVGLGMGCFGPGRRSVDECLELDADG